MLRLVLLTLACGFVAPSMLEKKIAQSIDKWNGDVACWGRKNALAFHVALKEAMETCSMYGSPASLVKPALPWQSVNNINAGSPYQKLRSQSGYQNWNSIWESYLGSNRQKRQTDGLIESDEEDFQEFLDDFANYKEDLGHKMGNLTCVLTKMQMLDSALQVNLQMYTSFWDQMDLSQTLAGSDPIWRQMLTSAYTDCYSIAQTFPQEALDRNPLSKIFGRHMIFFKCAAKAEKKCCYEAQMYDWIKTLYGEDPTFNWAQYGLPTNKYELAALTVKVMTEQASEEENFVGEFFYGKHDM